ncbi:MAG: FtsW/RodA/SpoVE family cell cycle protein [Lachnospiraceae bacterium]
MIKMFVSLSRYIFVFLMGIYIFMTFRIFVIKDESDRELKCVQQNILMFFIHLLAFAILFITEFDINILVLYLVQAFYMFMYIVIFHMLYKNGNMLLLNNMCMLMTIGFIMITRLSFNQGLRQFIFIVTGSLLTLVIPVIMQKVKTLRNIPWLYGVVGIIALLVVLIAGELTHGANIAIEIGNLISIQPSEFIKIVYVFFVASMFNRSTSFGNVVLTTVFAAVHVIILVLSTDLGGALIYFVVYLVMLYVATREIIYPILGITAGSGAAFVAYKLFSHVRTRVNAWLDPWTLIDNQGYQITQSLFAIGMGSWFGVGLNRGMPYKIPYVEMDFMFSAICEEFGIIFGICVILLCMNTFMLMMDVGMKSKGQFYKLLAVGLATAYGFQIFLTIGGGIKFIPLTGVTLPLISYGGSSAFSTLIMFAVIQGLFMLRMNER